MGEAQDEGGQKVAQYRNVGLDRQFSQGPELAPEMVEGRGQGIVFGLRGQDDWGVRIVHSGESGGGGVQEAWLEQDQGALRL
ncbi:hypothetical protein GCM10010383_28790 [Streptomyces lomondensis]|uniref:Uncharacterized protein n=1 Tax=Streptomyces lomondensis TaxID=68229 RepID=A0ABQ2X3H5_9ACTN|nr:hypothetical protein GCM10010383_28790 [Streptomyces lomondensis]